MTGPAVARLLDRMADDVLERYPVHHPDTAGRVLDGQAVVVTPTDSQMHTLNEVGTWLWERSDGSRTVGELAADLVDAFDVDEETARADLSAFVRQLAEKGVLELLDVPISAGPR